MKLYFFKQDALDYFKNNISSYINNYQSGDNKWIIEEYDDPFVELKLDVNDFTLEMSTDNINKADLENTKRIYENLKGISDSQATDERLWSGLAHSVFYEYVHNRWSAAREEKNMKKPSIILTRYFFGQHSPKFRHTLAKLWWIGRLTYDEENTENPFHLTEVLANGNWATRVNDLFTSSFCRNLTIVKAFLLAVKYYEDKNIKIDEDIYRSTIQFINLYGGMYLLDFLSTDEFKKVLIDKIYYYISYGPDVVKNAKHNKANIGDILIIKDLLTNERYNIEVTEKYISALLDKKAKDKVILKNREYIIVGFYKKGSRENNV